ncbi:MAG: hypothetical protein HRK26_05350 [Rickettsiaceae bacterium H1]|nr:hypothetical protein [Rickettsiaceae bacterium H1]
MLESEKKQRVINFKKEQKRIKILPNDLCSLGKTIFTGSIIINPIIWPIACYYLYNFNKCKNTEDQEEFTQRKKKSSNLLTFAGIMMTIYHLVFNGIICYCICHYFFRQDKLLSLYECLAFAGILLALTITFGITKVSQKKTEEQTNKEGLNKNYSRLFSLHTAVFSSGLLTLAFIPGPTLILGGIAISLYLGPTATRNMLCVNNINQNTMKDGQIQKS